jgi:hypothetical protein
MTQDQTASGVPGPEQVAEQGFRNRMEQATAAGFLGGVPTFHDSKDGRNHFGETIFVTQLVADLRDIPLGEWGNVALGDLGERIQDNTKALFRATQEYSARNGFVGGFPTLHHARAVVDVDVRTGQRRYAIVWGAVLFKQGERNVRTLQRDATFAARRNVLLH